MPSSPENQNGSDGNGDELIGVAYANDLVEAEMIQGLLEAGGIPSLLRSAGVNGPQVGIGLLNPGGGPQRVLVRAARFEEARALLAETLVEDEQEAWPESANARYLDEASGRRPRDYGLFGAYARIWLFSLAAMALAFAVFLLLRAV